MQKHVQNFSKAQEYWNKGSQFYLENLASPLSCLNLSMLSMVKIENSKSILEIGAGCSYLAPYMIQRKSPTSTLHITDFAESYLEISRKRIANLLNKTDLSFIYSISEHSEDSYKWPYTFPDINTTIEQVQAENLQCYSDNQFDTYIASLVLQVVESPEKMLQEAFRVLNPGGQICLSVWGNLDRSLLFSVTGKVLINNGIQLQNDGPNYFYLNDRQKLIELLEKQGFIDILCWDQFVPFYFIRSKKDFHKIKQFPKYEALISQVPQERKSEIEEKVQQELSKVVLEEKKALGLDTLVIYAKKP